MPSENKGGTKMTYTQAEKYLKRATKQGYAPYHSGSGIVNMDGGYGINIDGDGHDGRLFGCPQIIWSADQAEEKFPANSSAKSLGSIRTAKKSKTSAENGKKGGRPKKKTDAV